MAEISVLGGYDVVFTEELDERYRCPVCLSALRDPVQTKCGHRFCGDCLQRCVRFSRYCRCPVDNAWFDLRRDVFQDVAIGREVLSLYVSCVAGECGWAGELRDLEDHSARCSHVPVVCSNHCGVSMTRGELKDHLKECPRRLSACPHCGEEMVAADLAKHQLLACSKFPVSCSVCGETGILRDDIPRHTNISTGDCPLVVVKCPYELIGCYFQDKRKNMEAHHRLATDHHMMLVIMKLGRQDDTIVQQRAELERLGHTCQHLSSVVRQHEDTLRLHAGALEEVEADVYELSSVSWNGQLLWKVFLPDDQSEALLSPVLFTGRPGYRLQLRLDIHGEREGGQWFSTVSLLLQKGHMDGLLAFPVDLACELTVVDHFGEERRRHHAQTIRATLKQAVTGDSCIQETTTERLMETNRLLTRYVNDHAIFISLKVMVAI